MLSSPSSRLDSRQLGSIVLTHGAQVVQRSEPERAELLLPLRSQMSCRLEQADLCLRPPYDLAYLPPSTALARPLALEGWRVKVNVSQLERAALELSDYRVGPARCRRQLQTARVLQPRLHPERDQVLMLQQLLKLSDCGPLLDGQQLHRVGLDRLIIRMIALLLCGALIERSQACGSERQLRRTQIMDDLLLWIEANLAQPIQIRDLCRESGYAERTLRNLFQDRFSCGPAQWIRRKRMMLAREQLLQADSCTSVTQVAMTVGYQHLSQFSRDFQHHFGLKPSEMLRESLRLNQAS